jgi:hypothetical protein
VTEDSAPVDIQPAGVLASTEEAAPETQREEDDEVIEFTGKRSKKDKEKKGKKNDSTPASGVGTSQEREESWTAKEMVPAAALATAVAAGAATLAGDAAPAPREAEEDEFGFISKKSKKDKEKKQDKDIATEADDLSADLVQASATSRELTSPPAEPETQQNAAEATPSSPSAVAEKVSLHPAVSEALRKSPLAKTATSPAPPPAPAAHHHGQHNYPTMIGLGLIPDPPEPYPEDAPSPKLLTALATPPELSIDAQVEAAARGLGAAQQQQQRADPTPTIARDAGTQVEHDPPFAYDAQRKRARKREGVEVFGVGADAGAEQELWAGEGEKEMEKEEKKEKRGEEEGEDAAALAAAAGALTGGVALLAEKFGGASKKRSGKGKEKERKVDVERQRGIAEETKMEGAALQKEKTGKAARKVSPGPRLAEADEPHRGRKTSRGFEELEKQQEEPAERRMYVEERTLEQGAGLDRMDSETIPRAVRDGLGASQKKKARRERTPSPEPVQRAFSFPDDIADEEVFTTRETTAEDDTKETQPTADDPVRLPPLSHFSEFMRSHTSLQPVQEELSDDEPAKPQPEESVERDTRRIPRTPELHLQRDSGFLSGSPHVSRRIHSQHGQEEVLRDSGVSGMQLRDSMELAPTTPLRDSHHRSLSPSLSLSPGITTTPRSHHDEAERRLRRSPLSVGRNTTTTTPRLREPSPPPRTPEPEKSDKLHVAKRRSGSSRAQEVLAAAAAAAAASPGAPANSAGHRSLSQQHMTAPRPADPTPRRVSSNTSLARLRTPEPALRPDSPGSTTSPGSLQLRRMDKRASGDLRQVSLSQRDLAAKAREQELAAGATPTAAALGAAAAGAAGTASSPSPATSRAAAQLQQQQQQTPAAHTTTPVANEGRVRAKQDMADVYVSFAFHILTNQLNTNSLRTAMARAASGRRGRRRGRTACAAARACRCSSSSRASSS